MTRLLLALLLVFSLVAAVHSTAYAQSTELNVDHTLRSADETFVPGEIVYRYRNDTRRFRTLEVENVRAAVDSLRRNPNIEFAEPNYLAHALYVPNDPYYQPYQWNFDNGNYGGVGAEEAWDVTRGQGTVVAVIDTGIAYEDHQEGRGWWGTSYTQAPDLADTCFVAGYDFVNNDAHPNDDNGHGTHVAGTVAQSSDNGNGVAGLAYETCLMPVKVLDSNGSGTYTEVANGIYFAADNGADVINLSLGGSADSSVLADAVRYAYEKGVTVVASSGNNNAAVGYPAAYDDHVIAVGATRFDEARASYSNYGASLDLVAPGGDTSVDQNGDGYDDGILQQTFNPNTKNTSDFGYWFLQGTSMAAPHVAAAAALVRSVGNATTPDEIREALQSTAEDLGATGRDDQFGYGLINIPAALAWNGGGGSEPVTDEAPSVSLTAPAQGTTVSGVVLISANASDDNGVARVEFFVDGSLLGSDSTAPYEISWNSASSSDGSHTVSVRAIDTVDQEASDAVSVTVDNTEAPNVAPIADAGPDQTVEDSDNTGAESVSLDGSGSSDTDGTISSYTWSEGGSTIATGVNPTVSLALGTHTLTLTVVDNDGATHSDTVTIEIVEPAPPSDITLNVEGEKDRGRIYAHLYWSGAAGSFVDIYRNGAFLRTTSNDDYYRDSLGRGSGTFSYQVCEQDTSTCSATVQVSM